MELPGYVWAGFWVMCGVTMSLANKSSFRFTDFKYPVLLSTGHLFVNGILSAIVVYFTNIVPKEKRILDKDAKRNCYYFVGLFCLNIAFGNVSIRIVDLALSQTVRATMPIASLILGWFILGHGTSVWVVMSLIPVVLGVILLTISGIEFGFFQLCVLTLGILLCALKGIVSFISLKKFKINPFVLLMNLAPIGTIVMFCIAFCFGEVFSIYNNFNEVFFSENSLRNIFVPLSTCFIAFCLNMLSFLANRGTSPLTMAALGNVKQCAVVLVSIPIFSTVITFTGYSGILITFVGMFLYTISKYQYSKLKTKANSKGENLVEIKVELEEKDVVVEDVEEIMDEDENPIEIGKEKD